MTRAEALEREFDATAERYDVMVGLNPGYHEHLAAAASALRDRLPRGRSVRLVDLGCGSGASTVALVERFRVDATVLGVDASSGMLSVARRKTWPVGVSFRHGRAEQVADRAGEWGLDAPADGVLAAYLFRNITNRDGALAAVYEVLAPGGWLVVQEYSVAGSRRAAALWTAVCWTIVIPLSLVLTRRSTLYRYLWRSVLRFDAVERFAERLRAAGFEEVSVRTVDGWQRGILHTFAARRPSAT